MDAGMSDRSEVVTAVYVGGSRNSPGVWAEPACVRCAVLRMADTYDGGGMYGGACRRQSHIGHHHTYAALAGHFLARLCMCCSNIIDRIVAGLLQ